METISLGFAVSVFAAGLLSFFSPCILPLLPVYAGFLSTDRQTGSFPVNKKLLHTLAFTAGFSVTFFILGFGMGALGDVIGSSYFFIACGIIVFVFGLQYSGLVVIPILNRTIKLEAPESAGRGVLGAFLLGLFFSFGWTPCIGPVLGSVLSLSAQQGNAFSGGGLLLIYSLGLSIPFLVFTMGSGFLLNKVKKMHKHLPKIKLTGGLLIAVMGVYMVFSQIDAMETVNSSADAVIPAEAANYNGLNFILLDIDGNTVSLADFRGTPVYVKFWGTWCPSCLAGLDEFAAIANEYNKSGKLRVLSIVAPGISGEMNEKAFTEWANGQRLNFPILFDTRGRVNRQFNIMAYPTSVFIDKNGKVTEIAVGDTEKEKLKGKLESMLVQ